MDIVNILLFFFAMFLFFFGFLGIILSPLIKRFGGKKIFPSLTELLNLPLQIKISLSALVLTNLFGIFGVVFLSWSPKVLIAAYWLELEFLILFALIKMPFFGIDKSGNKVLFFLKGLLSSFGFLLIIGIFLFLGYLLVGIAGFNDQYLGETKLVLPSIFFWTFLPINQMIFPPYAIGLFLSHLLSFFLNFVGRKEYLITGNKESVFESVIWRIIALIIVGASLMFLSLFVNVLFFDKTQAPDLAIWIVGIFVLIKITIDILAHLHERAVLSGKN